VEEMLLLLSLVSHAKKPVLPALTLQATTVTSDETS
jgi:hypothetical protein